MYEQADILEIDPVSCPYNDHTFVEFTDGALYCSCQKEPI